MKRCLLSYLLIFFTKLSCPVLAQSSVIDSLLSLAERGNQTEKVGALLELGRRLSRNYPDSALGYTQKSIVLAQQEGLEEEHLGACNVMANIYRDQGAYEKAELWYEKLFELAEKSRDDGALARYYLNKGILIKRQGKLQEAISFYEKSIPHYEKSRDDRGTGRAYLSLGNIYADLGALEDSEKNLKKAVSFAQKAKDSSGLAFAFNSIGTIYDYRGELYRSLEYALKSAEIKEKIGDKRGTAISYNSIGIIQQHQKQYEAARASFLKGLKLFEEINFSFGIQAILVNLGSNEMDAGEAEAAVPYFQRSLEVENAKVDQNSFFYAKSNLGCALHATGEHANAKKHMSEALAGFEEMGDLEGQAFTLIALADVYIYEKKPDQALAAAQKALRIAREAELAEQIRDAHHSLAIAFKKKNQSEIALQHMEAYVSIKDSLLTEASNRQLTELNTLYETEKKERKIELLKKEKEIEKGKLKIEKARKNMLMGGIFLLFVIAALLLNRQRLKIQKNRQLRERDAQLHAHKEELMQLELEASQKELALRKERLQAFTHRLLQKNELLSAMEQELRQIKARNESEESLRLQKLQELNQSRIFTPEDWEQFRALFIEVYPDFFLVLQEKYSSLSNAEIRLLALLKLGLDNKRVADMLAISTESVRKSRYRLRKKLELSEGQKLEAFIDEIS